MIQKINFVALLSIHRSPVISLTRSCSGTSRRYLLKPHHHFGLQHQRQLLHHSSHLGKVGVCIVTLLGSGYLWHNYRKGEVSQSDGLHLEDRDVPNIREDDAKQMTSGEIRFRSFASLEFEGEAFMTPKDFLDSVIQDRPRPRIRSKVLSKVDRDKMLKATPAIDKYIKKHESDDPDFLRSIGVKGIISYPEYLFLLSMLTRPEQGFRFAFDLIDIARENVIVQSEFSKFMLMSAMSKSLSRKDIDHRSSTLRVHFFGMNGDRKLTFDEFSSFVRGLQREVLRAEFIEFSRGRETISETDFAQLLLRYANLNEEEQSEYMDRLDRNLGLSSDLQDCSDDVLTFPMVEKFFSLLNNIGDFLFAFRLHPMAGNKLNKERFSRAARISMGGQELDSKIVDVIFALFDKTGDNCLSYDEFFVVMNNRLHRQVRRSLSSTGWKAFKRCVSEELHTPKEMWIKRA